MRTKATRGGSCVLVVAVSGVVGAAVSLAIVVVAAAVSLAIVVVGAAVSQVAAHVFRHCSTPPEGAPGEIWGRYRGDIGEM